MLFKFLVFLAVLFLSFSGIYYTIILIQWAMEKINEK
jgi:hypothetical protein